LGSDTLQWELGPEVLGDFAAALSYEWLETNGLGGWASSTVHGGHSRRYHGVLVAATAPPAARMVLLSRLDETLRAAGESFELSCNQYPGAIHPRGHEHLTLFRRALFPVFEYLAGGTRLRKTVAAVDGESTTLVLYELLASRGPVELELRPFFAGRDFHSLAHANGFVRNDGRFGGGTLAYRQYESVPEVFVRVPGSSWTAGPDWYHDFEYAAERERGLDFHEDLFTPGTFTVTLERGARLGVLVSTADPSSRDAFALLEAESSRRRRVVARPFNQNAVCRALALAADQFLVRRGADLRTVIAGYHWFGDWGRDTMISLPGLCLVTGRHDEAKGILRAFAAVVDQGMLPNRFTDRGETPEYNTVDASLWFFVAIHRYLLTTGDYDFARDEMLPVLEEILAWHQRGTRHGIHADADGLLASGERGVQLTWMDAKVAGRVVTPRRGKPVEIQALWYNALLVLAGLRERFGSAGESAPLRQQADRVRQRFASLFWHEEGGYLCDCIDEAGLADTSLRPNQLLALSLPFQLFERGPRAERLLRAVEGKLLTPVGLRTLSPDHPAYRPVYSGAPAERDAAYHQGTVWPWLFGPYLTAMVRVRGEQGREQAREILSRFVPHLGQAGVGSISEVFGAEPPHPPLGCIAQAWSVAEVLRAAVEEAGWGRGGEL
jgi:predicted glycogen debranching enzyme